MGNVSATTQNDELDDRRDDSTESSVRPPPLMKDESRMSVMQRVERRNRQAIRHRRPPEWAMKIVRFLRTSRNFFRVVLPAWLKNHRREIVTGVISFAVHVLIGLMMAAFLLPERTRDNVLQLFAMNVAPEEFPAEAVELLEVVQPEQVIDQNVNSTVQQMLAATDLGLHRNQVDFNHENDVQLPLEDLIDIRDIPFIKGDMGGRSEAGRKAAVSLFGGNAESEKSVNLGLKWLQSIQRPDGSWSFAEIGGAGEPGSLTTTDMGATSLALLCFLGAGNTHKTEGPYRETVTKGLTFLISNAERDAAGLDLRGRAQGNSGMYVQGIATICLCEASAMERGDRELKRYTGEAIRFIERAQNKVDGGWRYKPGDTGDLSVAGWQIMALQSARAGRIRVLPDTMLDAKRFLTSMQHDGGARYGYMRDRGPSDSMTAVGLLCRMYTGWKRDNPALQAGVQHLARVGPSRNDIYFNYYATQVLHHWGGDLWKTWNLKLRDRLVSTQIKDGRAAGSWNVTDPHGSGGGRIYQTTLSLLTLEVYYRHLPIYRRFDQVAENSSDASDE